MPTFNRKSASRHLLLRALPAALLTALWSITAQANTLTINSLGDETTAGDGQVTLREAIIAANNDSVTDLGQIGNGADTLDLTGLKGTIALTGVLPAITSDITILGPGRATLSIVGGGSGASGDGIFFVTTNGVLQLNDLTLSGGTSQGGAGTTVQRDGPGGGAAGMGGAVLVSAGSFGANNVNFTGNAANGGNGGNTNGPFGYFYAGGGGGFGESAPPMGSPVYGVHATRGGNGGPFGNTGGRAGTVGINGFAGNGGDGGGGGGGGTGIATTGGNGGFAGGGGGAGWAYCGAGPSGAGGYGGGGGGGTLCNSGGYQKAAGGAGGMFGGNGGDGTVAAAGGGGGGGGGLGGALFVRTGANATLTNCGFSGNQSHRGLSGTAGNGGNPGANGQGKGGAIFAMSGVTVTATGVSFSGDAADDAGGGTTDNADIYGNVSLTQGSDLGFEQATAGVDATKTSVLHVPVQLITSDGQPTAQAGSVDYATADGTAIDGAEYLGVGGTINVPAATASGTVYTIDVPILNNQGVEPPRTFTVGLSNLSAAFPGSYTSQLVTIIGNDTIFRNDFDGDGL